MKINPVDHKSTRVFLVLGFFFITNAIVAEFMGVKIFSLDDTLGLTPMVFHFFGQDITGFNLTAGVLLWPFVFVLTDIINEYFGRRGVRLLSWITAAMIGYGFIMVFAAMKLTPSSFWFFSSQFGNNLNMDLAYKGIFGQGLWIIIGSLLAFLIGQVVDVSVFHWVKRKTGEKGMWLRSTGSTLISQLIDSFVVLFVAFYLGKLGQENRWSFQLVMAVATVNYIYKVIMAFAMTPVIYLVHIGVEKYLGHEYASHLKEEAMKS